MVSIIVTQKVIVSSWRPSQRRKTPFVFVIHIHVEEEKHNDLRKNME